MKLLPLLALLLPYAGRAAEFPPLYNSEPDKTMPMSAAEAAAKMKVPAGFKVTVFAAEPDVQNPIAMAWDGRGRLWVAENYTYAEAGVRFDTNLRDRIVIFEDADHDGHFDRRTVFTDDVQMLTSIEVGHGGVWAMCPPQLLFIPDRNGDDRPDAGPEVVLDGFTVPPENYHNFANGLRWGPDGWLYGRCGASAPGDVGAPGTAREERIPLRGGMWRYDIRRKVFEALTSGTTNPWGHDWDEHGELFFINTVNGHLWHAFPGAHHVRPHTIDPNPHVYALIDMHADHWHFDTAQDWTKSRDGAANALGGGHAHIGMMIYQGANWPAEYRGKLFTLNMHGRRANQEILERSGSGYVAHHGQDFLLAEDRWFRGIEISQGPDGGVYVLDWSDSGECHERNGVHRTSGRIFKITHGDPPAPKAIGGQPAELVAALGTGDAWIARQAQLRLAEIAARGDYLRPAQEELRTMFREAKSPALALRAMWALHAAGGADEVWLPAQLHHADEHVRAWAIRLLTDAWTLDPVTPMAKPRSASAKSSPLVQTFADLARTDGSALVRLVLASTLQRLPLADRPAVAAPLLAHGEDAGDHNLPLLIWYGLIPLGESDPAALAKLAVNCELPQTLRLIARRLGEDIEKNPGPIDDLLRAAADKPVAFQSDILAGLADALNGWRKAKKPAAWDGLQAKLATASDGALRDRVRDLSALFGDGRALDAIKAIALDAKADLGQRKAAVQTLIESQPPDLREICEKLLGVRFVNAVAVRGLARFDDPAIGEKLAKSYRSFHHSERAAVLETLVSRPAFAKSLLAELAAGRFPRADLTAFHARQIRSFHDPALTKLLSEAWGEMRDSAADKKELMAKLKGDLTPDVIAHADKSRGRETFNAICAACHTLYGHGGKVGPDLTGAGRDNLDYLLENIVDPSAVVNADFRMSILSMKDGRTLNGMIGGKTDRTVTVRTMTETLTVERSEIVKQEELPMSLMPEGLLLALDEKQRRDLFAYLMHPSQVPLPEQPAQR